MFTGMTAGPLHTPAYRVTVGEVGDDQGRPAVHQRGQGHGAVLVPGMHDHVVPGREERLRGEAAETVR